jgi:hypothetical protein
VCDGCVPTDGPAGADVMLTTLEAMACLTRV